MAVPVIFIHGRNAGPGVWGGMISFLESKGYTQDQLFAWSYDSSQSTNSVTRPSGRPAMGRSSLTQVRY
jgi:triacylglycerol esterase/lipase EstA (alpha/beta hydrolase family)